LTPQQNHREKQLWREELRQDYEKEGRMKGGGENMYNPQFSSF